VEIRPASSKAKTDPKLIRAIVRAHAWFNQLSEGGHASIEQLAAATEYNPKVIRQGLRLAFLAPAIAKAVVHGEIPIVLKQIPKVLPLSWQEQSRLIG
jgi:hypothetical protein